MSLWSHYARLRKRPTGGNPWRDASGRFTSESGDADGSPDSGSSPGIPAAELAALRPSKTNRSYMITDFSSAPSAKRLVNRTSYAIESAGGRLSGSPYFDSREDEFVFLGRNRRGDSFELRTWEGIDGPGEWVLKINNRTYMAPSRNAAIQRIFS